jgi:dihydrofolate reductase
MKKFSIVVAVAENGVIGNEGGIPWRIRKDMAFFRAVTTARSWPRPPEEPDAENNVVIMGRKTWESIPARFRPLPDRHNVVVSRNERYEAEGATTATSLAGAFETAGELAGDDGQVFVIGGQSLYQEAMGVFWESLDKLYLTQVHQRTRGDTFFPYVDLQSWKLVHIQALSQFDEEKGEAVSICTWRTLSPPEP